MARVLGYLNRCHPRSVPCAKELHYFPSRQTLAANGGTPARRRDTHSINGRMSWWRPTSRAKLPTTTIREYCHGLNRPSLKAGLEEPIQVCKYSAVWCPIFPKSRPSRIINCRRNIGPWIQPKHLWASRTGGWCTSAPGLLELLSRGISPPSP